MLDKINIIYQQPTLFETNIDELKKNPQSIIEFFQKIENQNLIITSSNLSLKLINLLEVSDLGKIALNILHPVENKISQPIFQYSIHNHLTHIVDFLFSQVKFNPSLVSSIYLNAIQADDVETISELIKHNFLPNLIINDQEQTMLHYAALKGNVEIVNLLIKAGADIKKLNSNGSTPLGLAIEKGHTEAANLLISYGFNEEEISQVLRYNRVDNLQKMFELGLTASFKGKNGLSILDCAIQGNLNDILKFLDGKVDWNQRTTQNRTLLMDAVLKKNKKSIEFLLSKPIDFNSKDEVNLTIFDHLILSGGILTGNSDFWLGRIWHHLIKIHPQHFQNYIKTDTDLPENQKQKILESPSDHANLLIKSVKNKIVKKIVNELKISVDPKLEDRIIQELGIYPQIMDPKIMETLEKHNPTQYKNFTLERVKGSNSISQEIRSGIQGTKTKAWLEVDHVVREWAYKKQPFTLEKLVQINKVLLVDAPNAGILRHQGLDVQAGISPLKTYVFGEYVPELTNDLLIWVENECLTCRNQAHALSIAALAYQRLISIHPFLDSNGRTSRMLMDYILQRNGLPPSLLGDDVLVAVFGLMPMNVTPTQAIQKVMNGIKNAYKQL